MAGISLYKAHVETICDLQELCKKHGYYIMFGYRESKSEDLDSDEFLEMFDGPAKEIAKKFIEECYIQRSYQEVEDYWFELCKDGEGSVGTMTDRNTYTTFEMSTDNYHDVPEDMAEFIYDNSEEWSTEEEPVFIRKGGKTHLGGVFKDKEVNCYREGICIREFSNLVCDFLGEPRINRCY